jgi:hypothetical protein
LEQWSNKGSGQAAGPFPIMLRPPLRDSSDALVLSAAAKIDLILAHSQSPVGGQRRPLVDTVRDPEFLADRESSEAGS